jgi:hypothetical protein
MEILNTSVLEADACYITLPLAEIAVNAAYCMKDIPHALKDYPLEWRHITLR